jgi:hypothetical protein
MPYCLRRVFLAISIAFTGVTCTFGARQDLARAEYRELFCPRRSCGGIWGPALELERRRPELLKERALTLSEILNDLHRHGWTVSSPYKPFPPEKVSPIPTDKKGRERWAQSRSEYFKSHFLQRVFDIRIEFSQLHMRDEILDDFFKSLGINSQDDINRQRAPDQRVNILPVEIEEVATRLQVLADQIKEEQR